MLEINGITKRFGRLVALDDVSFALRPGELFGFVGSNGAGKTTTMRIVLGVLVRPTAGRSAGRAARSTPTCGAASATCPRNAASTRR